MGKLLTLVELGRVEYGRALALQERLVELRRTGAVGDVLLLMEHEPVLTLGRAGEQRGGRGNILATDAELARRGIALHVVKRGGDVTYHGPGQLVGYPVLDLRAQQMESGARMGVVDYVRRLEEVLIRVAGEYGVRAQRVPGRTGVWTAPLVVGGAVAGGAVVAGAAAGGLPAAGGVVPGAGGRVAERKLAAIGVHVSRGITSHGFALNVTTDLRDFELIVPCGIADRAVTALELEAEAGAGLTVAGVGQAVARVFGRVFGRQVLAVDGAPGGLGAVHPSLWGWERDRVQDLAQGREQDRERERAQDREQDRGRERRQDGDQDRGQEREQDGDQDRGQERERGQGGDSDWDGSG